MKKQSRISIHYRNNSDGTLVDVLIVKWNYLVNPSYKLFSKHGLPTTSRWDTYNESAEALSGAIHRGWHTLIKGYASPSKSSVTALTEKALKLLKKDPTLCPSQTTTTDWTV